MTDKRKKRVRAHAAKTGMSYQASNNALTKPSDLMNVLHTFSFRPEADTREGLHPSDGHQILELHGLVDELLAQFKQWYPVPDRPDVDIEIEFANGHKEMTVVSLSDLVDRCRYDLIERMAYAQPFVSRLNGSFYVAVPSNARPPARNMRKRSEPTLCKRCNILYDTKPIWYIVPRDQAEREVATYKRMGCIVTPLYTDPEDPAGWVFHGSQGQGDVIGFDLIGYETRRDGFGSPKSARIIHKFMKESPGQKPTSE